MDINKYIRIPKEDIFHSTGYARVARNGIGAVSSESFSQRRSVNHNRQNVQHYGRSMIGQNHMREAAGDRMHNPLRKPGDTPRLPQQPNAQRNAARPFREPSSRGYNSYA